MKKLLFLVLCAMVILEGHSQEIDQTIPANFTQTTNSKQPVINTYTDRASFETAYANTCGGTLVNEDFEGGPGAGIQEVCGMVLSSAGDSCFPPGELEDGFEITVSNPNNFTAYYGVGFAGNAEPLVGDAAFPEILVINFPGNNVTAVGSLIFNTDDNVTGYEIYGEGGVLIIDYVLNEPAATEFFFGFIADEIVTRIEIEGANVSGNYIGDLAFGNCPLLGQNDNLNVQIEVYPNPVDDILRFTTPNSINILGTKIYAMNGQEIEAPFINGSINVSKLSAAIYFLEITTTEGVLIKKIIKR